MNISYKTNYEVLLYHFVEKASMWTGRISSDFNDFLYEFSGIKSETKNDLEEFANYRKNLDTYSGDLYKWAYGGFPSDERFNNLISIIRRIERLSDPSGSTVREWLCSKLKYTLDCVELLKFNPINHKADNTVLKIQQLFEIEPSQKIVDCFIVYNPHKHNTSGSAYNKDVLFMEINKEWYKDNLSRLEKFIIHEYFHVAVPIREIYENHSDIPTKIISRTVKEGHYDSDGAIFSEAVTLTCVNVLLMGEDSRQKIEQYSQIESRSEYMRDLVREWKLAYEYTPIIRNYINGLSHDIASIRSDLFRISQTL